MTTTVPFFRPTIGDEEIAEVVDTLRSGWLTTGPKTAQFERDFESFIGGGVHAAAVNSATAALHLGLEAMDVQPGDHVICPTLTFTATAEVIRYLGADPVFVDCDRDTMNMTPEGFEAAITDKTKAVMPVHFAGLACDMTRITEIARAHDIKVLDDAAHALPTLQDNRLIGNTGAHATAFSFYSNKTITTGEGGMLVSTDEELIDRARKMRTHGIDRDVFNRFTDVKASWRYDIVAPGYKYNLTDVASALGLHQLKRCDEFAADRTRLAARYDAELADLPLTLPAHPSSTNTHSWHLYIVRLTEDAPIDRDTLIEKLKEAGIGTSVHYTPLHMMSYWRDTYELDAAAFPVASQIFETCLSLPLFMSMTEDEQGHVISTLRSVLGTA